MGIVYVLILGIVGLRMFFVNRDQKMAMMLFSAFCLTAIKFPVKVPMINASFEFIALCFIFSELGNLSYYIGLLKRTFSWKIFVLVSLSLVVAWLNSPHFAGIYGLVQLLKNELLAIVFLLFYSYMCYLDKNCNYVLSRMLYVSLLILALFGILNLVFQHNYFIDFALSGRSTVNDWGSSMGDRYFLGDRHRINSMFENAFNYGYTCCIGLVLSIYFYYKDAATKRMLYMEILCCLFGIVLCGSRTVMFVSLVGIVIFSLYYFNLKAKLQIAIVAFPIIMVAFAFVPALQNLITFASSAFDSESSVEGSSFALRLLQYESVMNWIIDGNLLFGKGVQFANLDLNVFSADTLDRSLFGLESVVLYYLLERGIFGLFIFFFEYILFIRYFLKSRVSDNLSSSVGIAIIAMFLVFAIGTGLQGTELPTLLSLGILFSNIELYPDYKEDYNLNTRN